MMQIRSYPLLWSLLLYGIVPCAMQSISLSADNSWPQFRGPHGNGHATTDQIPIEFGDRNVVWKTELPGKAWSSPVAEGGVIWMTTAIEQIPNAAELKEILESQIENPGNRTSRNVAKSIALKLLAVDFQSGSILKTIELAMIDQPDAIHTLNSYASPTPVIDEGRIYCHFGTYGTFCVDGSSGQVIWQRRFPLVHSVGPGSSPLIHSNVLVLIQDGVERQYVTALDKNTGDTVWEADRPELDVADGESKKSFCTPISVTDKRGREQVICVGAHWVIAYEPNTGTEIWKCKHGTGFSIVPRPVCDDDIVYFSTGYGRPILVAVRIDGSGDVSDTHLKWTANKGIPAKPSPILLDGLIYVIDDTGVASCIDAASGKTLWKERIGGNYSSSPTLAGGHIYFASQDGKVTVIKPGRKYRPVAENQIEDRIMASPAIVGNSILLRTENAILRIE